jgi:hypothetical protein
MTEQQEINMLNRELFRLDVQFRTAAQRKEKERVLRQMTKLEARLMELYGTEKYGLVEDKTPQLTYNPIPAGHKFRVTGYKRWNM